MSEVKTDQEVVGESLPPLVDWSHAPKLRDLKQDLEDAKPDQDEQVRQIKEWLDNLNVEGEARPKTAQGRSSVQPKLIRKQAEWRYPALSEPFLSTRDLYQVSPVTWEDKDKSKQVSLVLNNQINTKINKTQFVDDYVRTVVDEGTAIVRTGWDFEEEEVIETQPIVELSEDMEMAPLLEELSMLQQESPTEYEHEVPEELKIAHQTSMEDQIPYRPDVVGTKEVKVMRTIKNQPTLEVCDFRNITIDPSCNGDLKRAGFVVYSFESSKAQLEREGKYKHLDHINIDRTSVLGDPDHESENTKTFNFSDEARKKFVVYEYWGYWDIDGSGVVEPIVATWVGDVIIRMEKNPFPDGELPFVRVQYLPVRRKVYGEPDGHLLEDNQKISGAVTRGMIDLMGRSANAQTGTRKNAMDATNRRKFERGQDYEFNPNVQIDQVIYQHKFPEIPQSAPLMLQMQNMEAESLTGVKAFANSGLAGDGLGDVATAVRGVLDAASKRELSILRRLAAGMVEIGRKIIAMNAEFLDEEEIVRITNDDFVQIRRDDLRGEFDLDLSISTAEEDNAKAQELAFMMQTIGNNADPTITMKILAKIARLRKMPDLAKEFEDYEPQPDPMQQENMMLQNELLKAQIANELGKAEGMGPKSELDMARARKEIAHAAKLQSESDQANLDFVEQESGVKQERDLEKTGEQARSNMQLKAMEHQLQEDHSDRELLREYMKNLR